MLWNNSSKINNQNLSTEEAMLSDKDKQPTQADNIKKNTATIVDAIAQEVQSANLDPDKMASIESSDTGKLSDKEYLSAFKQLKTKRKPVLKYTEKEVSTIKASDKRNRAGERAINNFNIVDVSQIQGNTGKNKTLAQQVSSLVAESTNNNATRPKKNPDLQDYLKTLKTEGEERKNEMRTIKVKRGETLWRLSIRAYGTGLKYKKIFEANPHLTSPHSITTGEILRVPL
jgi:nucleoid-associated protein YgaU